MGKPIRVIEGWTRDLGMPDELLGSDEEVEIYNAARPFPCHQAWRGEFVHGVFYGAIYPGRAHAEEYRERALELDASRLVFVGRAEVEEWARAYCEQYGIVFDLLDFDTIARAFLRHSEE